MQTDIQKCGDQPEILLKDILTANISWRDLNSCKWCLLSALGVSETMGNVIA